MICVWCVYKDQKRDYEKRSNKIIVIVELLCGGCNVTNQQTAQVEEYANYTTTEPG